MTETIKFFIGKNNLLVCKSCGTVGCPDDNFCSKCGDNFNKCDKCEADDRHEFANYCPKCGKQIVRKKRLSK